MNFVNNYSLSENVNVAINPKAYNYLSGVDHRSFTRAYGVEIDNNTGRATTSWKIPSKYLDTAMTIIDELAVEHGRSPVDGMPSLPKYMGHKVSLFLYHGRQEWYIIFAAEVNWKDFIMKSNSRCLRESGSNDDDGGMARAMLVVREAYINRNCEVLVSFKGKFTDGIRSAFYKARANASHEVPPLRTYTGDEDIPF